MLNMTYKETKQMIDLLDQFDFSDILNALCVTGVSSIWDYWLAITHYLDTHDISYEDVDIEVFADYLRLRYGMPFVEEIEYKLFRKARILNDLVIKKEGDT